MGVTWNLIVSKITEINIHVFCSIPPCNASHYLGIQYLMLIGLFLQQQAPNFKQHFNNKKLPNTSIMMLLVPMKPPLLWPSLLYYNMYLTTSPWPCISTLPCSHHLYHNVIYYYYLSHHYQKFVEFDDIKPLTPHKLNQNSC